MSKKFECQPKCERVKIESIIVGCPKCIKKKEIKLTKEQSIRLLKAYLN